MSYFMKTETIYYHLIPEKIKQLYRHTHRHESHHVIILPPICYERDLCLIYRNLCYDNIREVPTMNLMKVFQITIYRPPSKIGRNGI